MTPEELEKLPKPLERTMTALENDVMSEIIGRIKEVAQITPVTDWLLNRLSIIGASKSRIKKIMKEALEKVDMQVDEIYDQAVKSDYIRTKAIYEDAGKDYVRYEDNHFLQQIVDAVRRQTKDSLRKYENITQTTGFNIYMAGKRVFTPLSEYLERSLDKAMMAIATEMKTYSQAIGDVIDEMTSSGIRVVDYVSGKSDRIEVVARRAVMTGVAQMTGKVNEKNAEELQTDYWEVDWHMGARNTGTGYMNHQSWQGKVYSSEEMRTVCGLGEMLGFAGINCYHIRFPFIPGVSKRKYTDEWLAEQNQKENEKKTFRGKEYDTYGALQYQRKLERTIRKQKQDIELLQKGGADKEDLTAARCRKRLTEKTYTEFSAVMGLRQQRERLKIGKVIENEKRTDIIKVQQEKISYQGIPKTWKKLGKDKDPLKGVNPYYRSGDPAYKENCPNCVVAYEMRKREHDVMAKTMGKNHYLNYHPEEAWKEPDIHQTKASGLQEILDAFKEWPEGARAEIAVQWKRSGAHVFVGEKIENEVHFLDVQSGTEYSDSIFNIVKEGETRFWRIDKLEPSDRGITACEVSK